MKPISIFCILLPITAAGRASACTTSPSVEISNGTVVGVCDPVHDIEKFLGVPFAQPPIGSLRLRQAVPLKVKFGTLHASTFGHACYGGANPDPSEDCLTLNIWRPGGVSHDAKLPILVWIYGGGLQNGWTGDPTSEGTNLTMIARQIGKPVIYVSINYRLGSLGFLNGKQMAELGLLNIGMLDQRLALHWIQENIAAFGGDPAKVTLAGESAGAVSIYSHMMAYGGRDDGLFRGAIMQSGGAFPLTYPNTTSFQMTFNSLITNTTCAKYAGASAGSQLDCIRSLDITTYQSAVGKSTGQAIDGRFSQTSIQFALERGKYVKVGVLVGSNTDEGTTSAPTGINTTQQLKAKVAAGFFRPSVLPNSTVDAVVSMYPSEPALGCPYNTGNFIPTSGVLDKLVAAIFGDIVQVGPARMIAQNTYKHNGDKPVYKYRFNHLPHNGSTLKGISTATELNYVFSNSQLPDWPWDQAFANEVTAAWVSFAHDLDPNLGTSSSLPFWPRYGANSTSMMLSGYGSSVEADTYRGKAIGYIIQNVLPYGAK